MSSSGQLPDFLRGGTIFFPRAIAVVCAALAAATASAQQPSGAPNPALQLLDKTVAHYNQANTLHLEATTLSSRRTELSVNTMTMTLNVTIASGGRFRYEGNSFMGSGLLVSDGTTEWHLSRNFAQYTRQPSGSLFDHGFSMEGDVWALSAARSLAPQVSSLDTSSASAHFLHDQSLVFNGHKVRCRVIQYERNDLRADSTKTTYTVWIDPTALLVAKIESRSTLPIVIGNQPAPYGPLTEVIGTSTFSVTAIDVKPGPDAFSFTPPAGSTQVAQLPTGMTSRPASTLAERTSAKFLGKPLPAATLEDSTGAKVPLASFTGHPLLIDVWATWCGPCMQELPALDRLHKSLAATDLQMIGIDQDETPATADALLQRRGYGWKNFHAGLDVARQLGVDGLPTVILTDATGRIVYYGLGGDTRALAAAIAKLGKPYTAAEAE